MSASWAAGEGVGLADHPLRSMVLVTGIDVLEEDGMCAGQDGDVDAFGLQIVYKGHVGRREGRHELEADVQPGERVGKIKGGTAGHVYDRFGSHHLIVGYMTYATKFCPVHPANLWKFPA